MLLQSFLKGISLLTNWQVLLSVLLYSVLAMAFTLLLGAIGVMASNRSKPGLELGMGCLWQILAPLWQALLLAFLIGAITPIVLGQSYSLDIGYALSNLSSLWMAGLAGIALLILLSILPFINILVGGQDTGVFWIAIPIIIANFTQTGFWGTLGLAYSFVWDNFFIMILFALFSFVIATLGRFLTVGIIYLVSRFTDLESNVGGAVGIPIASFFTNLFEFIPLFSFMTYFVLKHGTRAEDIQKSISGTGSPIFGIIFIVGISFMAGLGFYKLVEFFVKKRAKKRGVEIGTSFFHISMFKGLTITLILSLILALLLVIAGALIVRTSSGDNGYFLLLANILTFGLFVLWVTVLYQLYKVAKILKLNKVLAIRPSLIVIFTIIAYYIFWWLAIIPFIVIWIKANAYVHYETKPRVITGVQE